MMMRSVMSKELRWRASSPTHPKRARERGAEAIILLSSRLDAHIAILSRFRPARESCPSQDRPASGRTAPWSRASRRSTKRSGRMCWLFLPTRMWGRKTSFTLTSIRPMQVLSALWGGTRRSASPKGTCEPRHGLWSRRLPIPTGLLRCKRWQRKLISYEWLPLGTFVPHHCFLACDLTRARGDAVKA